MTSSRQVQTQQLEIPINPLNFRLFPQTIFNKVIKMKKIFESAQIEIILFNSEDVIVASVDTPDAPVKSTTYTPGDDETEIL